MTTEKVTVGEEYEEQDMGGNGDVREVSVPVWVAPQRDEDARVRMETETMGPKEISCKISGPIGFSQGEDVRVHYGPLNGDPYPMRSTSAFDARVQRVEGNPPRNCTFDVVGDPPDFLFGPQLVGKDAALISVKKKALALAYYNVSMLITGESGTGKSLLAEVIHQCSDRAAGSLIKVNCPSVPETLLESELFGHEKGAFTGANSQKAGMLKLADGGTLVLEEISDLPLSIQGKLLQALEDREFWAVGGDHLSHSDARIIAITNDDVEQLVREKDFRLDLYYRINEASLEMPSLRERPKDIPLLCESFRIRYEQEFGKECDPFPVDVIEKFKNYSWPGNIRELIHVVKRWVLTGQMFPFWKEGLGGSAEAHIPAEPSRVGREEGLKGRTEDAERNVVRRALDECNTRTEAAAQLNVSYRTLLRKIKKYGL